MCQQYLVVSRDNRHQHRPIVCITGPFETPFAAQHEADNEAPENCSHEIFPLVPPTGSR